MKAQQIEQMNPALDSFLDRFLFCCGYTQTFEHLKTYCRGLLSDLPRKSIEPMALAAGTPTRSLQEFLKDHVWDHRQLVTIAQQHVRNLLPSLPDDLHLGTIGILDETAIPKKGCKTPGVQRQWCGRLGKQENCVVTVHLGVSRGRFRCLLDNELFLPEDWAKDRDRCDEAGIPQNMVYRPKTGIALDLLERARANELRFDWLTFDEGYGKCPAFLVELDASGQRYVGEVPRTLACLPFVPGEGKPADRAASQPANQVAVVLLAGRGSAVRVVNQDSQDEVWQAMAMPVWLRVGKGWSERPYTLIATFNARTEEVKYFVSNAREAKLEEQVRVGFRRAPIEQIFEMQKGEMGFGHYEGRNYTGMMRHQSLCLLVGLFASEQTALAQKRGRRK